MKGSPPFRPRRRRHRQRSCRTRVSRFHVAGNSSTRPPTWHSRSRRAESGRPTSALNPTFPVARSTTATIPGSPSRCRCWLPPDEPRRRRGSAARRARWTVRRSPRGVGAQPQRRGAVATGEGGGETAGDRGRPARVIERSAAPDGSRRRSRWNPWTVRARYAREQPCRARRRGRAGLGRSNALEEIREREGLPEQIP